MDLVFALDEVFPVHSFLFLGQTKAKNQILL